ncbi:type IV pili methyl-accepting chemotaxis transducer N-terminal domain-containing protein [Sanyastnella coralliicola]|uniref:type IV pili methyl-accepting chemotaxis transducer N-terminal domain-containing protein n=1 Tax=Sanyastnella coralliicola TaxID=3069118 RepID=UPI0027B91A73|nr:type IV pili methyl-accepting chemotaxis transducer N-terminal domain-containing protein [Longitalea sp. SCSIO 12813]
MKDEQKNRLRFLKNRYLFGLGLALTLLTINQVVIQYYLREKKMDASTVNVAGRQRMLSQRLGLLASDVVNGGSPDPMMKVYAEMVESNQALQNGNEEIGVLRIDNQKAKAMLQVLEYRLNILEVQLDHLALTRDYREGVLREQLELFLPEMNQIVGIIETDAEQKLQNILVLEIILFVVTVLLLILELNYFFKPLFNETTRILSRSEEAYALMRKMAFQYAHHIRAPLTNILSVIDLMKEKEGKSEYTDLLSASAESMDEHIKESVQELNDIDKEIGRAIDVI